MIHYQIQGDHLEHNRNVSDWKMIPGSHLSPPTTYGSTWCLSGGTEGGGGGGGVSSVPERRFYFCINNKAQRSPGANPYQMFTLMFIPLHASSFVCGSVIQR